VIWNRIMETLFKDPELERLLRGPDLSVPIQFPDPTTFGVEKRKICKIGGAFGQRDSEWFVPGQGDEEANAECNLYTTISAVRNEDGKLCRPAQGISYGDRLMTFKVWSLPPSTEQEHVVKPVWDGGSIEGAPLAAAPEEVCGRDVAFVAQPDPAQQGPNPAATQPASAANNGAPRPAQPTQTQAAQPQPAQPQPAPAPPVQEPQPAPPQPAPAPSIPSLAGLGENQARGVLAGLGVTNVVVDYQGPDRLGELYNTTPAYVVVSHSPGPGTPVSDGMAVVLGIRAP
jgi:hypothetical protein